MQIELQNLPVIKSLDEIKATGCYRIGNTSDLAIADCFGLDTFQSCKLPPTKIVKPNGVVYQIMIDQYDTQYFRVVTDKEAWGPWIPLDEVVKLFPTPLSN